MVTTEQPEAEVCPAATTALGTGLQNLVCWLLGSAWVCNHGNGVGWGTWSREKGSLGTWPESHKGA